jgi:hypothetical protein
MNNIAANTEMASVKTSLREQLMKWTSSTGDPRATNEHDDRWDKYEYHGDKPK